VYQRFFAVHQDIAKRCAKLCYYSGCYGLLGGLLYGCFLYIAELRITARLAHGSKNHSNANNAGMITI
jgi:hypothetical protein